jgi:hypothetical protein
MALNAFPVYVSGFDGMLSEIIKMFRRLNIGNEPKALAADTGVSAKLSYLREHADIALHPCHEWLYGFLVEIRHSVIHEGSSAAPVIRVWRGRGKAAVAGRERWMKQAGRELPPARADGRLSFTDREVVGCQRVLDSIAVDLSEKLRQRIDPVDWAKLVLASASARHRRVLSDPARRIRKLRGWVERDWGIAITDAVAAEALSNPLPDGK